MQILLLGFIATALAWGIWLTGGVTLTALEWRPYDHWMRTRKPIPASPSLVLVTRDAASDARFGGAPLDHALIARIISGVRRAGAGAIGVDMPVGEPSPPMRGGAASDAILIEATRMAGNVVYPLAVRQDAVPSETLSGLQHASWPTLPAEVRRRLPAAQPTVTTLPVVAQYARGVGHTLMPPDADGKVRRIPLWVTVGDRAMPAFALALTEAFRQTPTDPLSLPRRRLTSFIDYSNTGDLNFKRLSLLDVSRAIEDGETDKLHDWFADKLVVLFANRTPTLYRTPLGDSVPEVVLQANLLNTLLSGSEIRETAAIWKILGGLVLAILGAWLMAGIGGWKGIVAVLALFLGYLGLVFLALPLVGLVLPVFVPLSSLILATIGATLGMHLGAGHRIRLLEGNIHRVQQELAGVRESFVARESAVERLEEDLEAARAAVGRSTGKEQAVRAQLTEARALEEETRRRLHELESELGGLRATSAVGPLGDAELERLREECQRLGIITSDPTMLAVFRDLKKGAGTSLPVLILGEPGTGKELFARAVHHLSPRAAHSFVSVNMAAISPQLFESELFGHVKGSFTGAVADRKGYFELADHGTVFLDEIGDLPSEQQAKLLRVLQDRTFYRVGATRPTSVDVRVIAASNKDLQRGGAEGWFREDLYFRLKGLVLRLLPLRERPADIALLAERSVRDAAAQMGREGIMLSKEALTALEAQPWKGNVRELYHCLHQAVALAEGTVLTKEALRLTALPGLSTLTIDPGSDQAVLACLREHEFDMQATARALGWDRSTVTQRLKGLGFRAIVEAGGDVLKAADVLAGNPALTRAVEVKLREYHEHLVRTLAGFSSADEAVAACRKRFKNLPDRHFRFVEALVRQQFHRPSKP